MSAQATQERCRQLETEAVVLTDELTRTSAVAARAAAREVVNGSKDEGVVPVTLHLEEVSLHNKVCTTNGMMLINLGVHDVLCCCFVRTR